MSRLYKWRLKSLHCHNFFADTWVKSELANAESGSLKVLSGEYLV